MLGTEVTKDIVKNESPDGVIIATGAYAEVQKNIEGV
jgi:hypothetical protein